MIKEAYDIHSLADINNVPEDEDEFNILIDAKFSWISLGKWYNLDSIYIIMMMRYYFFIKEIYKKNILTVFHLIKQVIIVIQLNTKDLNLIMMEN